MATTLATRDREAIERALSQIASTGPLTPDRVVEAARDPEHALHGQFTWDDTQAAIQHRLNEARALIRKVEVRLNVSSQVIAVPYYVRDPAAKHHEQGYRAVRSLDGDETIRAVRAEIDRATSALTRALGVAQLCGIDDEVSRIIDALGALRQSIDERPRVLASAVSPDVTRWSA